MVIAVLISVIIAVVIVFILLVVVVIMFVVIASFHNIGGNFVRMGYEFLDSRTNFVGNISDSIPTVQMVAESKTEEEEQQINMIDVSDFNMIDVAAAVAELDELPDWVGGNIEEYCYV